MTAGSPLAGVSKIHEFTTWITTGANWTGPDGVFHLLGQHVWISALALAAAVAIGLGLSMLLLRWRRGGALVASFANATRAVPILGVMILLAVGPLGIGTAPAIAALIVFAIPPVLTNCYTGLRDVDPGVTDAARGMGLSGRQITWRVRLPLAIPLIATGVRLAAVQIWATATIAAVVGSGGLGQFITEGYARQDYGEIFGGTLVIVVTALIVDSGLAWAQVRLRNRYGERDTQVAAKLRPAAVA
jgi:osmoprotectant transport system permease protein